MNRLQRHWLLALAALLAGAPAALAQPRPYIGFVYPAGGQQGTTFEVRLGGQGLDGIDGAVVSGKGVSAKVVEYYRRLNPQDMQLMREQLRELKRGSQTEGEEDQAKLKMIARIESRMREYVPLPANASIASLAMVEVTIAPDAPPGRREITVTTTRGVSNPLVFLVGQFPEVSRTPMITARKQILGKEELALRKRPEDEVEQRVTLPCTLNGQIASGEVNRYRFEARKGQRLVISCQARQLVPFMADAVPGWFQPVMTLYNAKGKELAYDDDYRFKPDPVIFFEVPRDGEYLLDINDAIYRGREDFVYRITAGEVPFITSIFPLGGRAGARTAVAMKGWNLHGGELALPARNAGPGTYMVAGWRDGLVSNRVPFALDTLPERFEKEPNNDIAHAQRVKLPVIVNGRINRPDDWDVFQFEGSAGDTVVAEITARRLDSPLDSELKLTDASGKLLAFNDDHEDPQAGVNTHDADSYLTVKLPADGTYYVYVGDTTCHGGEEYAYRLRISPPRPDFALLTVPSSIAMRGKGYGVLAVHAVRKDGFAGPIKLRLKDPPEGFSARPVTLSPTRSVVKFGVRGAATVMEHPVNLVIEGRATIGGKSVVHVAVPAEDRMQAFLWRHLVPAEHLEAMVVDPRSDPLLKRVARALRTPPPAGTKPLPGAVDPVTGKPKFTKKQVAFRIRQIEILFQEGLITKGFHARKLAELEAAL